MTIFQPPSTNAIQKTLDAQLLSGVTASMTLNNVTGIQNLAGVCVIDAVDANGNATPAKREYISFTGVSGSTLTGLTRNADGGGTDQDHAVGAIVQFTPDVLQQQGLIDSYQVEHNDDGTHKSALVTTLKATGAEVNTGTEDAKIVTPKALADSDYAKTSDITVTADSTTTFTNKTLTSPKINEDVALTATATQLNALVGSASADGWTTITGTFTYASATTINVASGAASIYQKGDKLRFQNNDSGTWLYVYVVGVADTTLTVVGNAVPNAVLTDFYYSHQANPLGFPTYFAYTPTITWTAGTAPSGTPSRKEIYWIDGSICHVRGNTFSWTAGATVTGANIPLPFGIATQYQMAIGMISLTDAVSPDMQYAYVRNNDIQINCTSVNATFLAYSADYYY